jgi:hypothetical protein
MYAEATLLQERPAVAPVKPPAPIFNNPPAPGPLVPNQNSNFGKPHNLPPVQDSLRIAPIQ